MLKPTCMYCGKELKEHSSEGEYECNCADFLLNKAITGQIELLELSRPVHKYRVVQRLTVEEIKDV